MSFQYNLSLVLDFSRVQLLMDTFKKLVHDLVEENKSLKLKYKELLMMISLNQVNLLTLEERLMCQKKLSSNGTFFLRVFPSKG